jgi:hypothetical protein
MLIWPEASNAQNSMAAVSADGSTVCVLILRLNSSCSRSIALAPCWQFGEEVTPLCPVCRRGPVGVGDGFASEQQGGIGATVWSGYLVRIARQGSSWGSTGRSGSRSSQPRVIYLFGGWSCRCNHSDRTLPASQRFTVSAMSVSSRYSVLGNSVCGS